MNKKDTFLRIPNLKPETVRKHVDVLGTLSFVETVRLKNQVCLRLTQAGSAQ
jgi:GDP-D-mannose dehydratase